MKIEIQTFTDCRNFTKYTFYEIWFNDKIIGMEKKWWTKIGKLWLANLRPSFFLHTNNFIIEPNFVKCVFSKISTVSKSLVSLLKSLLKILKLKASAPRISTSLGNVLTSPNNYPGPRIFTIHENVQRQPTVIEQKQSIA